MPESAAEPESARAASEPERTPRRVVVAGASGLIGHALVDSLRADGVEVTTLVRRPAAAPGEITWDPGADGGNAGLFDSGTLDPGVLDGAAAVVNLNGASIGRIPWSAAYKRTLVQSRLAPTSTLARALRQLGPGAPAFVSSSAVGYYGSAPGERLTETSPTGTTFLAGLCAQWEAVAREAGDAVRVTTLRTAPVVHQDGVLKPLMLLTRFGLGGRIGSGRQVWPWISLEDEISAIRHVIDSDLAGPVNLSGPTRATANDLGFALAQRMNRPFLVPAPAFALRLALGRDFTEGLLTTDAYVVPEVLEASGFSFAHRTVEEAVAAAVDAPAR